MVSIHFNPTYWDSIHCQAAQSTIEAHSIQAYAYQVCWSDINWNDLKWQCLRLEVPLKACPALQDWQLAGQGTGTHTSKPPSGVLCLVFEAASEPPASAGRQDMAGHSVDNGPTHLEAKLVPGYWRRFWCYYSWFPTYDFADVIYYIIITWMMDGGWLVQPSWHAATILVRAHLGANVFIHSEAAMKVV